VNEDQAKAVRDHLRKWRAAKAPTTKARAMAAALTELPTLEQVTAYAQEIRIRHGVQDVTMIPDGRWVIDTMKAGNWSEGTGDFTRQDVLNLSGPAMAAGDASIHWPSLWQYGTAVFFDLGPTRYRAHTPDFGPSETYLSM
jgi:hypothetical protein